MENEKKLRRSRSSRVLAGVCGGIAEFFSLPVMSIRIAFIILTIFVGMSIWVYLGMWLIVPERKIRE